MEKVAGAARLGPRAAHLESAKGLAMDQCTGAGTIQIKIADAKFFAGALQIPRAPRINGTRQCEIANIGHLESVGKIARRENSQNRAEEFPLQERVPGIFHGKNRGWHKPALAAR